MPQGVGLADRIALLELQARAADAIDDGDADAWAACFTPDGALVTSRPLRLEGRAALTAFAREWRAGTAGPPRHMTWHQRFTADGDEVAGRCSAALLLTAGTGVEIQFTAVYRDRYARGPEGWLIRERVVTIDRPQPGVSD